MSPQRGYFPLKVPFKGTHSPFEGQWPLFMNSGHIKKYENNQKIIKKLKN